jgi:hypothetical protein
MRALPWLAPAQCASLMVRRLHHRSYPACFMVMYVMHTLMVCTSMRGQWSSVIMRQTGGKGDQRPAGCASSTTSFDFPAVQQVQVQYICLCHNTDAA